MKLREGNEVMFSQIFVCLREGYLWYQVPSRGMSGPRSLLGMWVCPGWMSSDPLLLSSGRAKIFFSVSVFRTYELN